MEQDAAEGQNVTEILYYVEKTVLLAHPQARASSSRCLAVNIHRAGELQTRKQFGEPNYSGGVQEHEDARTSHPCERRARDRKANSGLRKLARQI